MKITDDQIIEAGRILLQARKERGADTAGEVPSAVTAALAAIQIPDDAKHRGPSSPLTDAMSHSAAVSVTASASRSRTGGATASPVRV